MPAGETVVELVRWLQKGDIESEAPLLQALAQAPLPRKPGAPSQNPSLSAAAGDICAPGTVVHSGVPPNFATVRIDKW